MAAKAGDFEFGANGSTAVLNLHSTKGGVRRGQQEIVTIDDEVLSRWLFAIVSNLLPGDSFINLSLPKFRSLFADLCRALAITNYGFKPYSLRRGGATYDYRFAGNLDKTALRGRWADLRTARIYITDGLATQQEITYSRTQLASFRRFRGVLHDTVYNQIGRGGELSRSRRAAARVLT